jgi:hypothetical protein
VPRHPFTHSARSSGLASGARSASDGLHDHRGSDQETAGWERGRCWLPLATHRPAKSQRAACLDTSGGREWFNPNRVWTAPPVRVLVMLLPDGRPADPHGRCRNPALWYAVGHQPGRRRGPPLAVPRTKQNGPTATCGRVTLPSSATANTTADGSAYRFGGMRICRASSVNAGTIDKWTLRDYSGG